MEDAERRRAERIRQGLDPTASVIEAVRQRLDLEAELVAHGYEPRGKDRFIFPGSESGVAGVYVMRGNDGVIRAYRHHAADPLAANNLPVAWRSNAVDAVDVVAILDHGGDLTAALAVLATRVGIDQRARVPDTRHKETAKDAFKMLKAGVAGITILAELDRRNAARPEPLPPEIIRQIALWCRKAIVKSANAR